MADRRPRRRWVHQHDRQLQRDGVRVELTRGDIAAQEDLDAVVNAANAQLLPGGGVAGAIHRAAGPALADECRPLAPVAPGDCVRTSGHGLPNAHVLHCLGPVWGHDEPAERLLADCYRNALALADRHGIRSVGFPALSTGAFGYPVEQAADVALRSVVAAIDTGLRHVRLVRFVLFGADQLEAHERALGTLDAGDTQPR